MNIITAKENSRTLAALIGGDEQRAAELLESHAVITFDPQDSIARTIASFLEELLSRTLAHVSYSSSYLIENCDVEIVVGEAESRTQAEKLYVQVSNGMASICSLSTLNAPCETVHSSLLLLTACYAAAKAIHALVGNLTSISCDDPLVINFRDFAAPEFLTNEEVNISECYLAGAGAIGNAFVFALGLFNVKGKLNIADPDPGSLGNLNRCIFFTEDDVGKNKAIRLAELARPFLPGVELVPHPYELQRVPSRQPGPWLERLIIGVDSRRARRNLQTEAPREVYDSSTTDVREIVLHFNEQPLENRACLSCVYRHNAQEAAHEIHVAELLGVSVEAVRQNFVDVAAAELICQRYDFLTVGELEGMAYDSLFKELCGQDQLKVSENRYVLAPFSFVSVLAGTCLATEFIRRILLGSATGDYNYWRLSPWKSPVPKLKQMRLANQQCEFCGDPVIRSVLQEMWVEALV